MAHLGLDERHASIISYLALHGEGRSADLEAGCQLRQPQVSQATTRMEERGWLRTGTEKTPGKGRPVNVYSLAIGLGEIVEEITARRREEINRDLARIERAQNLVDRTVDEETERARREAQK